MQKIILFGLSEKEIDSIRNCGLKVELLSYDIYQDVLAHYAELTIMNPMALDDEGRSALTEFFREIDPCDEKVILTAENPAFDGISFVDTVPDLFDHPQTTAVLLMDHLKEAKRDIDFSRKIMLAIRILHLICQHPGIKTRQLSERIEISERSVKRYIRSLQAAGIMLEYEGKGWHCIMDPTELFPIEDRYQW